MQDVAGRLRLKARRFHNRRVPTATRYTDAFRSEVVSLARERLAEGVAVARIAGELGLRPRTLGLWLRRKSGPRLRRVQVEAEHGRVPGEGPATTPLVLVMPSGIRIEGLDLDGIVRVLRSMA
jgi:transposase-like protein